MINTVNWLYLEPFVYIAINSNKALLYNTLNGLSIESACNTKSYFLLKRLSQDKNLMVVELNSSYQNDSEICNLIKKIQKFYMGDVINMDHNGKKPFQLKPIYNIQQDLKTIRKSQEEFFGTHEMKQLINVSIQVNTACSLNCDNCDNYYKQLLSCAKNFKAEMSLQTIKKIFGDLNATNIDTINITGGDVFEYSHFESLIGALREYNFSACFVTHYENIPIKDDVLDLLSKYSHKINILIFPQVDIELLKTKLYLLKKKNIKVRSTFVIEDIEDYVLAEKLSIELCMSDYVISPFYNKKNISFFKENIFSLKSDLMESMPTIANINSKKVINTNYYGKLVIMSNGDVHANINEKKLGNINNGSLHKFVSKEMKYGDSWRKTRNRVSPCNKCIYKLLCPSISNYEYSVGKYNLCRLS